MSKIKVLGNEYGIDITRPFSKEMYAHNDVIVTKMKANIIKAVKKPGISCDELNEIARHVTGYIFGCMYSVEHMQVDILKEIETLQPWWLAQEYDELVEAGYCKDVAKKLLGFS